MRYECTNISFIYSDAPDKSYVVSELNSIAIGAIENLRTFVRAISLLGVTAGELYYEILLDVLLCMVTVIHIRHSVRPKYYVLSYEQPLIVFVQLALFERPFYVFHPGILALGVKFSKSCTS